MIWTIALTILAQIMSDCSFSRSFTTYCLVAMILLFGSVLEVIEKLRPLQENWLIVYQILLKMLKIYNNNARNSTTFFNYIRNIAIEDDKTMVLHDITSLYTNIPIIHTVNILKDYVNNDDDPFAWKRLYIQTNFLLLILIFMNKLIALIGRRNIFNYSKNVYAG